MIQRYEISEWNEWDGESLKATDDGKYVLYSDHLAEIAISEERGNGLLLDNLDLLAEIEQLKTALKEIASYGKDGFCPDCCDTPQIAIDALKETK